MQLPERFSNLPEYAFPRLRALLDHHPAGGDVLHMSIGEPKHPIPEFVGSVLAEHINEFAKYPPNEGSGELLSSISDWVKRRYDVEISPETQIIALNGTREGLFNACVALCPERKNGKRSVVLIPNPFYQVYAVAAAAANATAVFVPAMENSGFLPDFSKVSTDILDQTSIVYLCSPSNPQGAVASSEYLAELVGLAEKHDFRIFADECYAEIYRKEEPVGALQAAKSVGADPERVLVFHSLSKRSNLPGLRSGFACGGPATIRALKQLRSYSGAPLPLPLQRVATEVWKDERHVEDNRALYREKYDAADTIFAGIDGYTSPKAGFFLWLPVNDGEAAALTLWQETGIRVLPGAYLSREVGGFNPGKGYIRVAMVAQKQETMAGLKKIRACLY
ncbi:MAG: aminotransferase class I/II-fold pyridoxal phosphate-dependent enzyme [Rhodobacteraceae bacterium]|nr:aminotransferase class I/II-fold pyridoxal phosphate-dependent enzyme [Paracoccaceae bacterium]